MLFWFGFALVALLTTNFKPGTSMSDDLLYPMWGIRGYRVVEFEMVDEVTALVSLEALPSELRCSACRSRDVVRKGKKLRLFKGTPVGGRRVYFEVAIPRVRCNACGLIRQIRINFAVGECRYTRQFERYALEVARLTTTQMAAQHLDISWDTMRDIEARNLRRKYAKPKLRHLKHLAIDEIHLGKRLGFLTVVLDLDSGAIVFVGRGKQAESLTPFWKRLRASRAKIEAVAADMAPAYALAVRKHLPHAVLVNDRFHVIKLYNEMLTELRRELYREADSLLHKEVLKGIRWLLLKRLDNLDDSRREPERLLRALQLNESLATAYYLKDDLNQFWEQSDKRTAERFLDDWIADANASGIRLLVKFAKTLASRRQSLLAWYDYPISTGPLEATNNKIRLLHRQAFGYRDPIFFQLKLFELHTTRYALIG
jgi:transposase